MKRAPLRTAVLGTGNMGANHVRVLSLLRGAELVFIHDANPVRAEEISKLYDVPFVADPWPVLRDLDAVVLATPTSLHAEHLDRVLDQVEHVFVEKPMTHSLETSRKIAERVAQQGLHLQAGYIERFNPTVMAMKQVLDESSRVVEIDFVRTNKLSSRITDVDVVTDLMIHDIDLALLFNGPVSQVYAYGICDDNRMIGYASAVLTHENGRFSSLTASRVTEKRIRQIHATCEDMFVDGNLLKKELLITKQTTNQAYRGVFLSSVDEVIEVSKQEALLSELVGFLDAARSEKEPVVTPAGAADDLAVMEIADRVQRMIRGELA